VRLVALRGSERRVVRIVGMVGLTQDETPVMDFPLTKLYLQLAMCGKMKKSDTVTTFAIKQLVILFNEYWKELKS